MGDRISKKIYMKISIGVCARNEELSILSMLDSLVVSVSEVLKFIDFHIHICANGCTDQTIPLIENWQKRNLSIPFTLTILEKSSLVEAQRIIIEKSTSLHYEGVIFLDADIILDKNTIKELIKEYTDTQASAVYAVSIPIHKKRYNFIEKVLNLYDTSENIFSERKHLHGRAFLIKTNDWCIPKTNPPLIADDIYLSFCLLEKYGPKGIKRASESKVYFTQISSYTDFYNSFRRRYVEIRKCLELFSEFKLLPAEQVNRKFLWKKLIHQPIVDIFLWISLVCLRKISKIQFIIEEFFSFVHRDQWVPTYTSKKIGLDRNSLLILIEGLDCSGKKTTARLLQKRLSENGISSSINIGPLSSKIYRNISHFVSLHRFPNFVRSIIYSFDGVGDKYWHKRLRSQVIIQISSPMRNWAYAFANKKYLRILIAHIIKNQLPRYDFVWYLTVPYEVRLSRHLPQVESKENADDMSDRFLSSEKFSEMEDILKKLLNSHYKIEREFDTSNYNSEQIVERICQRLL